MSETKQTPEEKIHSILMAYKISLLDMKYITNDMVALFNAHSLSLSEEIEILKALIEARDMAIEDYIFNIEQLKKENNEMVEAIQYFIDRVDKGEIRSNVTYNKYKQLLYSLKQL